MVSLCIITLAILFEERSLVIPNDRRVTPSGTFSSGSLLAGAILVPHVVISHLCRTTTLRHFRSVGVTLTELQKWYPLAVILLKRQQLLRDMLLIAVSVYLIIYGLKPLPEEITHSL